jgi:uncharacterized surface protein with fasciclin (FAS1) repeats
LEYDKGNNFLLSDMNKKIQTFLPLLLLVVLFTNCRKKAFDDYYARPDNLAAPIYQQLAAKGNFANFLSLIDKAGYKQTLSTAGYWTIFAPSDSAFANDAEFQNYLKSRNINSLDAIDSATALSIVQYLLVYNGSNKDRLDDYQSTNPLGYISNAAYKRRTAYYTGFYTDTTITGQQVKAIASNRNNTNNANYYVTGDNNNKYIPYFTSDYFSNNGLSSTDYSSFYPNTPFSGFNVVNAKVTQQDIAAENGVIHIIDHVVTPLLSIDQYLRVKPEYSEFRKLFETYMVQFIQNADATHRYQVLTGKTDNVLVKQYYSSLAFSPNNENFTKLQENDAEKDGWTMMAPKNDSLLAYLNRILQEGYGSVSNLPLNVIADLLNSHMWQTTLWPSKYNSTINFLGEAPHISFQSNVIERKMLSNGIFYGTNKVNEPNKFSTVYGKAYLNPKFSLMTKLLDNELNSIITNPAAKYTVFMMPDAVLRAQGFDYSSSLNQFTYNGIGNDSVRLNLIRILNSSVVQTQNGELDNLGTTGFTGSGIITTYGGEPIKYNGNTVSTAGTNDRGLTVKIDSAKTASNGRVIYLNNLLYFTYQPVGVHLATLGGTSSTTSEYNLFWNYLKNSTAFDAVANTIVGMAAGSSYSIFVPNNNAIRAAITAGLLPGTATTPNFTPTSVSDKALVEKFIYYHVVDKRIVIPVAKDANGIYSNVGSYPTLLRSSLGDPIFVNVAYPSGNFELSDVSNRKAHIVSPYPTTSTLSNRTVIHLIDNYLKYN